MVEGDQEFDRIGGYREVSIPPVDIGQEPDWGEQPADPPVIRDGLHDSGVTAEGGTSTTSDADEPAAGRHRR